MKKFITTVIVFLFVTEFVYSQHLFQEKFDDCNTAVFTLESRITTARISDKDLLRPFLKERSLSDIEGILVMQIYIDQHGEACLVSSENQTYISTKDLNLNTVTKSTKWSGNDKPVCAIVRINFNDGKAEVKRFGLDGNLGVHEITDKPNPLYDIPRDRRNTNTSNNPIITKDEKTNSIWKLYTYENSMLPYNLCRNAAVDSKGNIWIGTDEGILKIEGENWIIYDANNSGLESNKNGTTVTWDLAIDNHDRIWTKTMSKIKVYDGEHWITFDETNSPLNRTGKIHAQDSTIWVAGFNGFFEYTNEKWTEYNMDNSGLPSNTILNVHRDKSGNMWVGTNKGLAFYDGKNWKTYNRKNSKIPADYIRTVTGDRHGNIWIGADTGKHDNIGGVIKITPDKEWTVYTVQNSKLPNTPIEDIKFEGINDEITWICTNGNLVRIENANWDIYNSSNSFIPNNYVSTLAVDHNGNKWIATFNGLIFTTR